MKKIPKAKCEKCKHCSLISDTNKVECEYLNNHSTWYKPKYCSNFEKIGGVKK